METATFANRTFRSVVYTFGCAALIYFGKKAIFSTMFTVSECDLISNTITSHDSAPIRGRPTLKDAERFHLYSPSELTLYRASCSHKFCVGNKYMQLRNKP